MTKRIDPVSVPAPRQAPSASVAPRAQPRPPAVEPVVRALSGLAQAIFDVSLRTASRSVTASARVAGTVVRRALDGDNPTLILQDVANELRGFVVGALGLEHEIKAHLTAANDTAGASAVAMKLTVRGALLLRQSSDVIPMSGDGHPAFERILSEITPDEARILRYLHRVGPQPAIDIRTNRPLGIGSELVVGGMNMIAEYAGLHRMDRIYQYLTNLNRLGLVNFSKEQVDNPGRYQLIEAQPKVADVLARAGHAPRIIHRSIRLTSFGDDFCRTCIPADNGTMVQAYRGAADRAAARAEGKARR